MRVHAIYLIDELAKEFSVGGVPSEIDGNTTPNHAWKVGYLQALKDMVERLKMEEEKEQVI